MAGSDEDHGRSRRPGAEDWRWSHKSVTRWSDNREVGYSVVGQSRGRVTVFSGSASKLMAMVFFGFTSKLVVTVSPNLGSKLVVEGFLIWVSKLAATVW
jgi:hypothetical protein